MSDRPVRLLILGAHPDDADYAAGGYSFKHRLTKPGTYTFFCDLHQEMKMSVVVRRA